MIEKNSASSAPTAQQVAMARESYDWLTSVDGVLRWVESSPDTGRAVVMSWHPSWGPDPRSSGLADASVGSDLHTYGGVPYALLPSAIMPMVNASTGQISGVAPAGDRYSYGDLAACDRELLCVREDERGDELVAIDLATASRVLRVTDGFLASPRWQTGRLAWAQWDRDVMPWDSCEVWVANYLPGGRLGEPVHVAGGQGESAFQPAWADDGALYFMSDRTGWWNLYRWRAGRTEAVAPIEAECAAAPWESGYANYVLLPGGRIGMTVQHGPRHRLVVVEPSGGITPVEVPYTFIKPYLAVVGDQIALIGASPTRSQEIALVATDGSDEVKVVRSGTGPAGEQTPISVPDLISADSGGAEVTVLFYPPVGSTGPSPLIIRPHAGPTYGIDYRLDWEAQFFTTRGFAVADVDYRGSTGYGRAFRKALDGVWGSLDVEDCRNAAMHLIAEGKATPGAIFISGASAGGYTALQAACEDGPFSLAVARSAIVDPSRWMATAPRFQRPHAAILTHNDARVRPQRIRRPVLLIHGGDDDVAPVDDVAELADSLAEQGLPVRMLKLDGIGHYLSGASLAAALDAELDAYLAALKEAGWSVQV